MTVAYSNPFSWQDHMDSRLRGKDEMWQDYMDSRPRLRGGRLCAGMTRE